MNRKVRKRKQYLRIVIDHNDVIHAKLRATLNQAWQDIVEVSNTI